MRSTMAAVGTGLTVLGLLVVILVFGIKKFPGSGTVGGPVKLAVYYETLCPDSQRWVKDQLAVAYPLLGSRMEVDIYPYGKASDVARPEGGYTFSCQHGARECEGNKMLTCAKEHIKDQAEYVNFNICVMSKRAPPSAGATCAQQLGISFTEIDACSNSLEGEELLHLAGVATHSLAPSVHYVPWMVVNGVHTDTIQRGAEYDLVSFICNNYLDAAADVCADHT